MKRKSSLTALFISTIVIIAYNVLISTRSLSTSKLRLVNERTVADSLKRTAPLLRPKKKGAGLRAFYEELSQLGFRKGDGGSVLFRRTLLEPRIDTAVFLRIYVASTPANVEQRTAIRETWASEGAKHNVSTVFLLGRPDSGIKDEVREEADVHGDILLGDYRDAYDNLAFKSVSMLTHFSLNYPHPEYLMKTDDDIFVNVPNLVKFLRTDRPTGIIGCDKSQELQAFSSTGETPPMSVPSFVVGAGYVIEREAALALPAGCLRSDPLPVEDIYITSRCARAVHPAINGPRHYPGFSCGRWIRHPCDLARSFTGHHVNDQRMRAIMRALTAGRCVDHNDIDYSAY